MNTAAFSLYDALPADLKVALAVAVTEPEYRHLGSEPLRHLTRHVLLQAPLDTSVLEILDDTLDDWLATQAHLQEQAKATFERLVEHEWVDLENSSFPGWHTCKWAQDLTQPWSERLPQSILDAEAHLDALS